ncbi:MAG: hypothetical protein RL377_1004 [Bacteroidota bacterium]|jgi:flagellar basal body-associated protein FliL
MKKNVLIILLMVISVNLLAQETPPRRPMMDKRMQQEGAGKNRDSKREKIELYKIQFITKELALTPEEAQLFWPVYETNKKAIQEIIANKSGDEIQLQEAILAVRKKYKNELKPILKSEERINNAMRVDREFMNKVRFEMMRRGGM